MATTTASPALVGEVFEDTPAAAAGLQPGDRIVEIEGEEIGYWHDLTAEISDSWDQQLTLKYRRDGELHTTEISPEKKVSTDFLGLNVQTYGMIGIHLGTYGTTLALADRDGPAARAGLESFDGIVTIDGEPIERFDQIASKVRNSDGAPLEIVAMRRIPLDIDYGKAYRQRVVRATVEPERVDGQWTIGVVRAEMVLTEVEEDSPARAAGLQVGDRIVALDERSFNNWSMVNRTIHNTINEKILEQHEKGVEDIDVDPSFEVTYVRQGERHTTTLEPRVVKYKDESKQQQYRFEIGWNHFRDTEYPDEIDFPFFERVQYAATNSVDRTGSFVKMIVMGFVRMAQGRISLGNVGGPILIGELAAKAGEAGWEPFLQMMALISINLGVFNLLPIPLLDGGHLLLYLLEAIKRGPLSFRARQIASYIGMVLVLMLFVLAFKNDIERKWDDIVEYVNE
jgi:regulator of sigma E protease